MRKLNEKVGQDLVAQIQRTAVAAGEAYEKQGNAFEGERQAEISLLEKAIELARPGLPAVCSRVEGDPTAVPRVELTPGLFILQDGRLAQGGDRTVVVITREEALDTHNLPDILRPLAKLFEKQAKGREPSTVEAQKRAAKLLALVELL